MSLTLIAAVPVLTALVLGLVKLLTVAVALRGTRPKERPAILRALAECFRWWKRPGAP